MPSFLVLWLAALHPSASPILTAHPIYISLLEMRPNPRSGTVECAMRIFSDDLELAVKQWSSQTGDPSRNYGKQIWPYIRSHFHCPSKKDSAELHLIGLEGDPDAQWVYFEIRFSDRKLPDKLELQWTTLLHDFPGQRNMLHLEKVSGTSTYIFESGNSRQTIDLSE